MKVANRLINFSLAMRTDEAKTCDALHVDFEPQGQTGWSGSSVAVNRVLLDELANTYAAVRSHLDGVSVMVKAV